MAPLGLVEHFRFLRRFTDRRTKVSITGRIPGQADPQPVLPTEERSRSRSRAFMNLELRELVRAGAEQIQIDEPYYRASRGLAVGRARHQRARRRVDARVSLHVCYGNRYGKPSWEGSYRYLFPAILEARIHQITLEFAARAARTSGSSRNSTRHSRSGSAWST